MGRFLVLKGEKKLKKPAVPVCEGGVTAYQQLRTHLSRSFRNWSRRTGRCVKCRKNTSKEGKIYSMRGERLNFVFLAGLVYTV